MTVMLPALCPLLAVADAVVGYFAVASSEEFLIPFARLADHRQCSCMAKRNRDNEG